jgi:uncharacterized protein
MILLQPMLEPQNILMTLESLEHPDILSIEPATISYHITKVKDMFQLHIKGQIHMVLACSKTLKPVPFDVDLDDDILFGDSLDADFIIEPTIDLEALIHGVIISLKPVVIYHPDADGVTFEEEKEPNIFETLLKD